MYSFIFYFPLNKIKWCTDGVSLYPLHYASSPQHQRSEMKYCEPVPESPCHGQLREINPFDTLPVGEGHTGSTSDLHTRTATLCTAMSTNSRALHLALRSDGQKRGYQR